MTAEQVAIVRRVLAIDDYGASTTVDPVIVGELAVRLRGVADYLALHRDRDSVQVVITEPGIESQFRRALETYGGLPPAVFQTRDAFVNLARSARDQLSVLTPFVDDEGAEFLLTLFLSASATAKKRLICRPLSEDHCGRALRPRLQRFRDLAVEVLEYARPYQLRGRETFHAKLILADDISYYVGSSNLLGSSLERSLECGVIVSGSSAREVAKIFDAICVVARAGRP